jgi:UDP-N-acetylmuramate dehydrogenase
MCIGTALKKVPDLELKWQEPLWRHTSFRVGGPVEWLARPGSELALANLLGEVRDKEIPFAVLGGGSNVLPPDEPWKAVVIKLELACRSFSTCQDDADGSISIYAGAGVSLRNLVRYSLSNEWEGIESLVGIPGTVGGALVMNAGIPSGTISDSLLWIDLLDGEGERHRIPRTQLSPSYRSMGLPEKSIVLGGCFRMRKASAESQRERVRELMEHRKRTQPLGYPSAGSIFRNPAGGSAGELIEKAGLKGVRIGDAEISRKHANWIINRGNARARDVLDLIEKMEKEVFGTFGVRLEREIRILSQS